MNEELQQTLELYGITIEEYMLGCDISDEEFYAKFGNSYDEVC
jgi:hypothetical protein